MPDQKPGVPSADGGAAAEAIECVTYPVDAPLTASFDPSTGALTLESTVHRDVSGRDFVRLRLNFSPDAAHGFVRLLKAVERELGMAVARQPRPPLRQ
jgi:hypothetical protein